MRVLFTASSIVLTAIGIRRLPGADLEVEDFKSQLKKHGPRDVVGLLQSFIQGSGASKWSDIDDEITNVIGNLTAEVVGTLTSENTNSQNEMYRLMNDFAYWIEARTVSESHVDPIEWVLAGAVQAEKIEAENYQSQLSLWKTAMKEIPYPCSQQQYYMEPSFTLHPQTVFTCDFSENDDTSADHCETAEKAYETNSTGEVNSLKQKLSDQRGLYDEWKLFCEGNITEANTAFGLTKGAYDAWVTERNHVGTNYSKRKDAVCPSAASCSADGQPGLAFLGLEVAVVRELSAGTSADNYIKLVDASNISESLSDRNYELESLNIVNCLLSKLQSFGNDGYDNEAIGALVDTCSSAATGSWAYTGYTINYMTDDTDDSYKASYNTDACVNAAEPIQEGTSFSSLTDSTDGVSIWTLGRIGNVNVGSSKVSMYSTVGIPQKMHQTIDSVTTWSAHDSRGEGDRCASYFFDERPYDKYYPRTGFQCTNEDSQTLKVGNFVELERVDPLVPTAIQYLSRADGHRAFTSSGITDCSD